MVEVKEAFTQPDMDMIYNMTYDESRSGDVELAHFENMLDFERL